MKHLVLSAVFAAIAGSVAVAQTTPAPSPAPTQSAPAPATPAPVARDTTGSTSRAAVNAAPLENGANSFTEGQAQARLTEAGITGVSGLAKDNNGVWRGRGSWQGRSVAIGLDFRGNISAQ